MKDSNYINIDRVIVIKQDETAIVSSYRANETMVLITNPTKPFGLQAQVVNFYDTEDVMQLCRKSGFPNKFICAPLNEQNETYFCTEGHEGGRTLCVKEIEENGEIHLKLCIVFAKNLEEENKIEMEM